MGTPTSCHKEHRSKALIAALWPTALGLGCLFVSRSTAVACLQLLACFKTAQRIVTISQSCCYACRDGLHFHSAPNMIWSSILFDSTRRRTPGFLQQAETAAQDDICQALAMAATQNSDVSWIPLLTSYLLFEPTFWTPKLHCPISTSERPVAASGSPGRPRCQCFKYCNSWKISCHRAPLAQAPRPAVKKWLPRCNMIIHVPWLDHEIFRSPKNNNL